MPKETIKALGHDVERVLVAGAHLAGADSGLARDKAKLDALVTQLGAKAPPVLGRLSEQTAKAMTAKPKKQAEALVSLAMNIAQVRAAQTQLAPAGETEPLADAAAVETPCNAKDLYALHDALVHSGSGRMEKIRESLERGDIADLRLVHAAIQAMGDSYGELADTVSTKVVPRFGRAIVEPVRSKLKFPGRAIDGRRLRALVAVEKTTSKPLLEQALREGSADMRESALDAMASDLPGVPELEPIVLDLIAKEKAAGVRRAAIRALKGYSSDASLEALLVATTDGRTLRAATEALGGSKHPEVVTRLLARLAEAVQGATSKTKAKPKDAKAAEAAKEALRFQRSVAESMLGALADLKDPRIVPVARELVEEFGDDAAMAVLNSGGPADLRWLADHLNGKDEGLFEVAVKAAIKLENETFDRLMVPLRAKDRDTKIGKERVDAVVESGLVPSGDRWVKALLEILDSKPRPLWAATLLGKTKDKRATKPLLDLIAATNKDSRALNTIVDALGELGDPSAFDPLLEVFASKRGQMTWYSIYYSMVALADQSAVDKVRTIAASEKTESYQVRHLLRRLEQKFPGA